MGKNCRKSNAELLLNTFENIPEVIIISLKKSKVGIMPGFIHRGSSDARLHFKNELFKE